MVPYWHLPAEQSGWWGYPIVVYGREGDRYLVDDRNTGRLTIGADKLVAARSRIPSYKNRLVVADPAASELDEEHLGAGVRAGLEEQLTHLSEKSASFSLPAFDKWAKMLADNRNAKSWSKAFDGGVGLIDALVSVCEQVDDRGLFGGSLRRQYAEFLDGAEQYVDLDLSEPASAYVAAAESWLHIAAVCRSVRAVNEAFGLSLQRRDGAELGDGGHEPARKAAEEIAAVVDGADALGPDEMADLFSDLSAAVRGAADSERDALEALRSTVAGRLES